ncbi:hypothetical protein PG985_012919 [Apiospora marii]|uniref:uncharacterized protein n=1 Tax=Apiospora marii TaxID=335849 RepID=UPI00313118FB
MASFLDLPREIRDDILHHVLLLEHPAPAEREDEADRTPITDITARCRLFKDSVLYEKQTVRPMATALMLANRQLNNETQAALYRLPDQGRRFKVDIMFLEERELWVTFTHVPLCRTSLDQVDVTIRLVGTMRGFGAGFSHEKTIWAGDHGPPAVVFPFYYALERFLRAGPTGQPATTPDRTDLDRHMVVKHLVLNFVSPDDPNLLAGPDERILWRRARRLGGTPLTPASTLATLTAEREAVEYQAKLGRPEWLAGLLASCLRMMINTTPRMALRHGGLLYERVGEISVKVDGATIEKIDLGAMIDRLSCHLSPASPRYEDVKVRFDEWHVSVLASRRAAGL